MVALALPMVQTAPGRKLELAVAPAFVQLKPPQSDEETEYLSVAPTCASGKWADWYGRVTHGHLSDFMKFRALPSMVKGHGFVTLCTHGHFTALHF